MEEDLIITNLELVKTDIGNYYWYMDSEYGYLNSVQFLTIEDAIISLVNNKLKWTECHIGK